MNAASPKIALLVAAYNCQDDLNSSIRQLPVEEPLHILIVDDGSTPPLLAPPCDPIHAVEMVRNKVHRKIHGALRRGIAVASARGFAYVARLDAGDLALAGRFRLQREFLDRHPEVAVVGSACQLVEDGRVCTLRFPLEDAQIRRFILLREQLCHPAVMMRVGAVIAVGNYRGSYPCVEDLDLFLRLMNRFKAANLPELLTRKGEPSGSITVQRRRRMIASLIRLQLSHLRAACWADWAGLAKSLCHWLLPLRLFDKLKLRYLRVEADGGKVLMARPPAILRLAATPTSRQRPDPATNDGG